MKRNQLVVGVALAAAAGFLFPASAHASTPWPTDVSNSSYLWEFDEGIDFYGSTNASDTFTSQYYETGLLNFSDGFINEFSGNWCTNPIEAPGAVTTDGADTVVTCAPYDVPVGQPGAGLTATVEIRIINALNVARIVYKVDNSTGADIDVPFVTLSVAWEYNPYNGLTSSGVRGDGSNYMDYGDKDTWIITAEDNSLMPSGIVWAAGCDTSFIVSGDDASFLRIGTDETTTFVDGTTTYYGAFLQMETPVAQTDVAMNAAIDSLGASLASRYAYLSPELSVGLPAGAELEFWDPSCAPTTPELPNTGFDSGDAVLIGVTSVFLMGAGVVFIARRRSLR